MYVRPDRPLVVKCSFDRWNKHISFASAKNCSYDLLKDKIEQCFSLYATPYVISYKDDDGEVSDVSTENDLTEAIQYFQAGSDDPPLSSAASILSGRSFGSKRRITLRVLITVDYDGPSLSDTSSLASLDEYKGRNRSNSDLSWLDVGSAGEPEDDRSRTAAPFDHALSLSAEDRGAAWLRDQNARAIKAMLGATPPPSETDSLSISMSCSEDPHAPENIDSDLALQRDPRGKYYYSYTGGGSSTHDSGYEEGFSVKYENDPSAGSLCGHIRPNSMQLSWLASQQKFHEDPDDNSAASSSTSELIPFTTIPDAPPDVPQIIPSAVPPPGTLTTCSECGVFLDVLRYVCAMCGEKEPDSSTLVPSESNLDVSKGKEKDSDDTRSYLPSAHRTFQLSSMTLSGTELTICDGSPQPHNEHRSDKPLPCLPSSSPTLYNYLGSGSVSDLENTGYELCSECIESAGIRHAVLATGSAEPGSSIGPEFPPEDAMSSWIRSEPRRKGQLRHAYFEKLWGPHGWVDVEQEDMLTCRCSTCRTAISGKRYKCASCKKFNICRACYSQVHRIHPTHSFLLVMENPARSMSESEYLPAMLTMQNPSEEQSMKHPGVKCTHCLQDILGARFHCAVCDSVDICSNCESAGLPGNLDSSDGGHMSSHIMIKIPYPLETHKVQTASRRAFRLWTGRDAAYVLAAGHSRPSSECSSYAKTVVGSRMQLVAQDDTPGDHRIICDGCHETIYGTRYQCATCPSSSNAFSLCASCEERSYMLHDPMHVFFKLPRPVHRPLQSSSGLLPKLYKVPVGPMGGAASHTDPKEYLSFLVHSSAACDLCCEHIHGAWYRCAYCGMDLCAVCEALDTHDPTHLFIVFKAPIDMSRFRQFANLENPAPIIPFSVY